MISFKILYFHKLLDVYIIPCNTAVFFGDLIYPAPWLVFVKDLDQPTFSFFSFADRTSLVTKCKESPKCPIRRYCEVKAQAVLCDE